MKNIMRELSAIALVAGMALSGAAQAELITNGGFESAGFDGWTQFGTSDNSFVAADAAYTHSGDHAAFFGAVGSTGGIAQQLATTVGQRYTLNFWLGNMGANPGNDDTQSFFAVAIDSVVQPASLLFDKTASNLTSYAISFTAASLVTDLSFAFRQDEAFWFLDDVSVDAVDDSVDVPEPGTLPLLLAALAGWFGLSFARRNAARDRQ
jgi:hypothetical protein